MGQPAFACIAAGKDLSTIGGAGHQVRASFVKSQLEHCVAGLVAHLDAVPAVSAIAAEEEHPGITLEVGTCRDPDFAWIARHFANVAAIDLPLGIKQFEWHMPQ